MKQYLKIILSLIVISTISLAFKLYLTDFSIPLTSDNMIYALNAISYKNGDFAQLPDRASGWSFLLYPFFSSFNSDNFLDYSTIARILSISIATISIPIVYIFGRKFFNEKYSLVVASLFAFEPHLNYNSGAGLAEPLFGLIIILMAYFILNKETKYVIPSLALAAILWWVRINGFTMFIIISIIYFISFRNKPKLFQNYGLGVVIFLVIISPMLIQRYEQFGDPLYFWYGEHIFAGNYEMTISANTQNTNHSALDYIDKNGIISFIDNFILKGIYSVLPILAKLTFPYLFIIIPFGVIFSFRAFDQDKQFLKSIWIFIVLSLATLIVTFSVIPERRFLYYLFPFLMVLGTITIQRVTEYGLSTFSFSNKQKNYFLILVLIIVIILATTFVLRYERADHQLENEKLELATFIVNNLHGKMLDDSGPALEYVSYLMINDPPGNFQNYRIDKSSEYVKKQTNIDRIYIYAESVEDLVSKGESFDLKYFVSNKQKGYFHQYVDTIYENEERYPFLKKVFDSNDYEFKKLKVKIFEIDYEKFGTD